MPPRKRPTAAEAAPAAVDYGPGDGLMLYDVDPVLCVGLGDGDVLVRVGQHHSEPVKVAHESVRKATYDEVSEYEHVYTRQLAAALHHGELGAD